MTRAVSVGRSNSLIAAGALGITLLTLAGCPGTLDNPAAFPGMGSGAAGTTGAAGIGAAGTTGMAGTGAAGTSGNCDMVNLITKKYTCTIALACHDGAASTSAGLSMQQADWPKLVGTTPNGMNGSICGADPMYKTMPYIMKGSATGDGLLLKKLMAPTCSPSGQQMPSINGPVSAADLTCFQQWATQLANM